MAKARPLHKSDSSRDKFKRAVHTVAEILWEWPKAWLTLLWHGILHGVTLVGSFLAVLVFSVKAVGGWLAGIVAVGWHVLKTWGL